MAAELRAMGRPLSPEPGNAGGGKRVARSHPSPLDGIFDFMIEITINGQARRLEAPIPLDRFLEAQGLPQSVVVERNGEIVQRDRWHLVTLRDGDVLEIVRLVGGG